MSPCYLCGKYKFVILILLLRAVLSTGFFYSILKACLKIKKIKLSKNGTSYSYILFRDLILFFMFLWIYLLVICLLYCKINTKIKRKFILKYWRFFKILSILIIWLFFLCSQTIQSETSNTEAIYKIIFV